MNVRKNEFDTDAARCVHAANVTAFLKRLRGRSSSVALNFIRLVTGARFQRTMVAVIASTNRPSDTDNPLPVD